MAGAKLTWNLRSIDPHLVTRINKLAKAQNRQLLNVIGATVTSQTQRRIFSEKEAPDGTPWPAWEDSTAANRHGNQSLLFFSGALAQDIHHQIDAASVDIGSNLAYAATHQFGDTRTIQVPAHSRTITQAFGKKIDPKTITVKGHAVKRNIKAREYLGVSKSNATELVNVVNNFLNRHVTDTLKGLPA